MRSTRFSAAAIVATVLLAGVASADSHKRGKKLQTELTGAAERPGPGDADGSGTATFTIHEGRSRICYALTVADIDTATAAHIHLAGPDSAGPVRVTLAAPVIGASSGCIPISAELADDLHDNPENYYVNVHNAAFPAGAIRGQLN